jgi:DNA-nicking Smr family endonuclease
MSARDDDDAHDDALWQAVTKTVTPLRKTRASARPKRPKHPAGGEKTPPPPVRSKTSPRGHAHAPAPVARAPALPPLAALDRRTRGRVARGSVEIEGRLDLHGHRADEARHRLLGFLKQAQAREKALVLVITGKGTVAPKGMERGILKREVPLWLGSAEFRPLVIGFEQAASHHGGSGALYVRVRRIRS